MTRSTPAARNRVRASMLLACAVSLIGLVASGCGGGSSSAAPKMSTGVIDQSTTVNLIPVQSNATGPRFIVMVTAVGSQAVAMPLAFDTGSAGITLYAQDIFPSSMVDASGFVFTAGQSSLSYHGITVMNQQGTRKYGSTANGRTQTGNIGYATVTFGDAQGMLTTQQMPIFLYYLVTDNATSSPQPIPLQRGWFGVNSNPGFVNVANSIEPADGYPECTLETTGSCRVVSILKYFSYASGVDAGFMLDPATLQACDITVAGSCNAQPLLTVGLIVAQEAGFSTVTLTCPPATYTGPSTIQGFPVCQASIPDSAVTLSGPVTEEFSATPLFDTGNPAMALLDPASGSTATELPAGTSVTVMLPSGFTYSYESQASGPTATSASNSEATGIGIEFFTTHHFFIDFTTSTEGWQ